MRYSITHDTTYSYSAPVLQSYHILHLSPRSVGHQVSHQHRIVADPAPAVRHDKVDYFGNPATILSMEKQHSGLSVRSESQIEVLEKPTPDLAGSQPWNEIASRVKAATQNTDDRAPEFVAPSRNARPSPQLVDYARPSFADGRPILEAVSDLTGRIFNDFTFDNSATDISTPVEDVLKNKRGVCQDFAHLEIAALRSLHLPVRYVSGYILTQPPKGKPKLQGADASHAWISVWAGSAGWVDFDPTNNLIPSSEHITIAYGRDYDDVSPISGVLLGGGTHTVHVAVDVGVE